MEEANNRITKIIEKAYKSVKEILSSQFSNLYFYISPMGDLSCWVRLNEKEEGIGVQMPIKINIGQILYHQWHYLKELNEQVEVVRMKPDEYFYCTECGKVKKRSEFADSVFAGYYCKECAKKPEIEALITQSHKRGFYE